MKLYTPIEIEQVQQDLPYLIEIMEWVKSFLSRHHPDLGRPGPVCPYVPHAFKSNSIEMAVIRTKNYESWQIEEIVGNYRDIFLETAKNQKEATTTNFTCLSLCLRRTVPYGTKLFCTVPYVRLYYTETKSNTILYRTP